MSTSRIGVGRQFERLFGIEAVGALSDAELIERFAAVDIDDEGAAAAFEAIVARHGPMILRVCRKFLGDAHLAEDAFQATFLVLARRARTLGEREQLGSWLYGVALRTSRKARIAAARRAARDRIAAGQRSEARLEPEPDEREEGLSRILHEEIGRLPASYRTVVVACYLHGLTHSQAAARLRLPETTVRGRLARARSLLGHRLTRRGIVPTVALLALENEAAACAGGGWPVSASCFGAAVQLRDVFVGPAAGGTVPRSVLALADAVLSDMRFQSLKGIALVAAMATVGFGLAAAAVLGPPPAAVASAAVPSRDSDPTSAAEPRTASPVSQDSGKTQKRPTRKTQKSGSSSGVDPDLAKRAPGPIVRSEPLSKDCTIIAYLPNQNLGHVDNFALLNYGGGIRALIDWPAIPADEAAADRKFLIALYSRKTNSHPPSGRIHAFEILDVWPELNSWSTQPEYDPEPIATYKFEPGDGWKFFDITPLVRAQAKAGRKSHGILLRFLSEDFKPPSGSGYDLVSREGAGEWASRRPIVLVVKDTKAEKAQTD